MTEGSDQQGATVAGPPAASRQTAAGGALTVGSVLTVAGILLLFVIFALAIVTLQCCFRAWDRGRRGQEDSPSGRRRCRGSRAGGSVAAAAARGRGVDPELLRSLPVTVYRAAASKDAVECAVCLAELEDGEAARFLPRCGHGFHAECVDMWLASHTTCPLCRLTVAKPPDADAPPALPPAPAEPANYTASVLLGVPGQGAVAAVVTSNGAASRVPAIDIPELDEPAGQTPRDAGYKSPPGSARLRAIRRLWSFGRQGAGPSSASCSSCAGAGEGDDLEQGASVTIAIAAAEAPPQSEAAAGATRGTAV